MVFVTMFTMRGFEIDGINITTSHKFSIVTNLDHMNEDLYYHKHYIQPNGYIALVLFKGKIFGEPVKNKYVLQQYFETSGVFTMIHSLIKANHDLI